MKKLILIFCLLFFMVGSVSAQQVLGPTATGGADSWYYYYSSLSYSSWSGTTTWFAVGYGFYHTTEGDRLAYLWQDAVMEFDISGVLSPAGLVNMNNFRSARLDGLSVINTIGSDEMTVFLYDMLDVDEDGSVTTGDWHSMRGSGITLFTTVPTIGTTYNKIDVTDALLNDLFGAGSPDYSGFLLTTETFGNFVEFDDETPTLTIFIKRALSAVNHLLLKGVD